MNLKIFVVFAAFTVLVHLAKSSQMKQNSPASTIYEEMFSLPINLTILYKPLHHRSRTFFLESLRALVANLNQSYFQLNLIPAGDSVVIENSTDEVQCASPDQCTAMELQACALELYFENYPELVFNFIYCTFKNKVFAGAFSAAESCAKTELSEGRWTDIYIGCYSTGRGRRLLADNIQKTQALFPGGLPAVPTAILNGDQIISNKDYLDLGVFKTSVCDLIQVDSLEWCTLRVAKKIPVRVFYESTSVLSKVFFTRQLDPWCVYLEEIITLELYPAGNAPLIEEKSSNFGNKLISVINEQYFNKLNSFDGDSVDLFQRTLWFHTCFYSATQWKNGNESTVQDFLEIAQSCAQQSLPTDEWYSLLAAINSKEGDGIYSKVVSYTKKFKIDNELGDRLTSIPWVTIQGSSLHSRRAANDLFLTVCSLYPSSLEGANRPLECTLVEVKVFYSAADFGEVGSANFFLYQLPPVFWRRRQRINMTLIPYFGLSLNGSLTSEEECQHDLVSCKLNTAHACAVKMYFEATGDDDSIQWDGKNQTLAFISCTFEKTLPLKSNFDNVSRIIEDCASAHFISGDLLSYCAQGQQGRLYLEEMRNRILEQDFENQHLINTPALPVVFINGIEDSKAKTNFKAAVCGAMVGDKLGYCFDGDDNNGGSSSSSTKLIIFITVFCFIILPFHLFF